jgi:hypothetical protein
MEEDLTIPKRFKNVHITMTIEEKWEIDRLAASEGMSTSNYMRSKLGLPLMDKPGPKQPKVKG